MSWFSLMIIIHIYSNEILGKKFVCIYAVDHELLLRDGVLGPGLQPALDVGHLTHSRHQIGELRVGGKNLKFNQLLILTLR